jgi:hypothetical protein
MLIGIIFLKISIFVDKTNHLVRLLLSIPKKIKFLEQILFVGGSVNDLHSSRVNYFNKN